MSVWLRSSPDQVTECPLMRYFLLPVYCPYLIDSSYVGRKASVDTHHLAIDYCPNSKSIETCHAVPPDGCSSVLAGISRERESLSRAEISDNLRVDAPIYLVEETIDLGDLSTLMISSQQRDMPWKLELQAEQQAQSFDRIMPSIHEVS